MWKLLKDSPARREVYGKVDVYSFLTAKQDGVKMSKLLNGQLKFDPITKSLLNILKPLRKPK